MSDIGALIEGFRGFQREYLEDAGGRYRGLADYGPHSRILMVACCDSRADPAIITNSSAGDLMVIRNIANLVPPYGTESHFQETRAALEFATSYLDLEPVPMSGDRQMPRVYSFGDGASERFGVAPGREADAYFHMPGGQSGHPLSPFYRAGHEDGVNGAPSALAPGSVVHRLRLLPGD